MYSVLVVDDEPLVRLTLKNMNAWESFGFFFGSEAAHGRQALEILQGKERIDIVILDLNMPVMNGLELIEWLQLMDDRPEILILSCHNDFQLVRKAFKLGVSDYILKTEMEPDNMLAHLKELAARLEMSAKRKAQGAGLSHVERKYLRKQLLKNLLSGQLDQDVSAKAQQFGIRLREDCLCLAAVSINSCDIVRQRYEPGKMQLFAENVINIIAQILAKQPYGEVFSLNEENYALFFSFAEASEAEWISKIYTMIREIEQSLRHYLDVSISYGLSDFGAGFDAICGLYKEAEQRKTLESRIVKQAKRYISEHFSDPELDLQEISAFVGITKNHLSYQFSRETGEHLRDYINRVRIEEAKKLLLTTNKKVYEVCDLVGYKNVESFSRIFKKLTGVSPNRYSHNFQDF